MAPKIERPARVAALDPHLVAEPAATAVSRRAGPDRLQSAVGEAGVADLADRVARGLVATVPEPTIVPAPRWRRSGVRGRSAGRGRRSCRRPRLGPAEAGCAGDERAAAADASLVVAPVRRRSSSGVTAYRREGAGRACRAGSRSPWRVRAGIRARAVTSLDRMHQLDVPAGELAAGVPIGTLVGDQPRPRPRGRRPRSSLAASIGVAQADEVVRGALVHQRVGPEPLGQLGRRAAFGGTASDMGRRRPSRRATGRRAAGARRSAASSSGEGRRRSSPPLAGAAGQGAQRRLAPRRQSLPSGRLRAWAAIARRHGTASRRRSRETTAEAAIAALRRRLASFISVASVTSAARAGSGRSACCSSWP